LVTNWEWLAAAITYAAQGNRVGLANRAIRTWMDLKDWVAGFTLRQRIAGVDLELGVYGANATPGKCRRRLLTTRDPTVWT